MEAVILMGIQASGKSSFYRQYFLDTHIRLNLDMLKTRHREQILLQACLEAKQPFVIDNTNPTINSRHRYIELAKKHKFKVIGYYFQPSLEESKQRNQQRKGKKLIPLAGLLATYKSLTMPSFEEGFDLIYTVKMLTDYSFNIKEWQK